MRLHRFYIGDQLVRPFGESSSSPQTPQGGIGEKLSPQAGVNDHIVITSSELVHQLQDVFRLEVGDKIIVFNGTGFDYECKIDSFEKRNKISGNSVVSLTVLDSKRNNHSTRRKLFLGAAIVKKDTFEWIVEKATELGVTDIIPIAGERSEKKALNEERLKKIAVEASEQSGRDTTPMVWQIMGPGSAVSSLKKENPGIKIVVFHTEGKSWGEMINDQCSMSKGNYFDDKSVAESPVAVFIGPEGGWASTELEMFHKENVPVVCLGPQILRAETAVVAALSMVVFGC